MAAPAMQRYLGDSRNGLSMSGLADVNGTLLTGASAIVTATVIRNSDGATLKANQAIPYGGSPGLFLLGQNQTLAGWFPSTDTISVVWTATDPTGQTLLLTKTLPGRPEAPTYSTYMRLSERVATFAPGNLVGAASASLTISYRSGRASFGPAPFTGAGPFSPLIVAASRFPANDVATVVMAATDTLGLAQTQVFVLQDNGD